MCRGGQVMCLAAMLQTRVCACYFHAWKYPGPPEHSHPWLNTERMFVLQSSIRNSSLAMWWQPYSYESWTLLIHCCILGNDVISWGVLASAPASPSTTPTAEPWLWREKFRERHWSLVFLWHVSAGQTLTLNACFDAAVREQLWANEAYLMAPGVKKMKLQRDLCGTSTESAMNVITLCALLSP